eukprot:SM000124S25957  [mRNA]  locus=s124:391499:396363:+ [translate_table: standard]
MTARTTLRVGLIDLRSSSQAADKPDQLQVDGDGITSEEEPTRVRSIAFPPSVTARQRAALHEAAKEHGLQHGSKTNSQGQRMLTITRPSAKGRHVVVPMEEAGLTDACSGELTESLLGLKLDGKLQLCSGTAAMGLRREQGSGSSGRRQSAELLPLRASSVAWTSYLTSRRSCLTCACIVFSLVFFASLLTIIPTVVRGGFQDAELARSIELATLMKPETAQRRGLALLDLKCVNEVPGLFGRTLLILKPNQGECSLPPHKFWRPRDIVALKRSKAEPTSPVLEQGIVYDLKEDSITVVVDDIPEKDLDHPIHLEKLVNDAAYQLLKDTLMQLTEGVLQGPAADLVLTLIGIRPPTFAGVPPVVDFFNGQLDQSQQAAVFKALSANDVFLLHGPPGTGKTTAVVEIILQEVSRGRKVLACAASNIAVDNLVERLATQNVKLVRLGHPARLLPQVLECSLDAQVLRSDNSALANDAREEMKQLEDKLLESSDRRERASLRQDMRWLAKEERRRQQPLAAAIIRNGKFILATLTGALSRHLRGRRCVLAGDHLQLPPTVLSKEAERLGLGVTLLERLSDFYGDAITSLLDVQYRMHEDIMRLSSEALYSGKVKAHSLVAGHKLLNLDGVSRTATSEATLVLVDTAGCEMEEAREEEGDSMLNDGEAHVAIAYAERLLNAGVAAADIGIITPYSAQVKCLKQLRDDKQVLAPVEVSTVDGFQGREKEAIIISMVRSNGRGEVGFLAERRRMNVAVTRARRQCCVICDRDTVTNDVFLKDMIGYFEAHGELLTAKEVYPQH